MSAKAKQLIIIYTAAALVTLSVLSAVLYSKLAVYRLTALYSSSGAFETTVSAVDGLSRSLKKSLYVTDATLGRSICTQAYANALAAEAALSALPFSTQELEQLSGFLNRAGDYAKSLGAQSGDKLSDEQKQQLKTKRLLAAQGFYEASTLAFYSNAEFDMLHIPAEDEARKAIRILNPISENLSVMRTLLAPSMLNVIVDNLKKGNAEGRLFEMAPVYLAKELPINEHPHERQTLCIGAFGPEEDFFTVKGALEALAEGFDLTFTYQRETTSWLHPGISAAVYCNGKRLGVFGKLANEINAELEIAKEQKDSQNIYLGELDYEALMSCVEGELRYKPLSPYAAVKRDLALVCDEAVACGDIEETIKKASPLITEVKLFDIYRGANLGEGKKSMAFSLTLSDPAAEVSNEQVERTVKKVLGNLKFKLGIEIR